MITLSTFKPLGVKNSSDFGDLMVFPSSVFKINLPLLGSPLLVGKAKWSVCCSVQHLHIVVYNKQCCT